MQRPGHASSTCLAAFPERDIDIYHISHFGGGTMITLGNGKIIKGKSNHHTLGRPCTSALFMIPFQHLAKVG